MSEDTSIVAIGNVHAYLDKDGTVWLNAEDVARGLGFVDHQEKDSATSGRKIYEVIRWARVNQYLSEFGYPKTVGSNDYIPENMFYRLAMKANNSVAEKFQVKVADEILPAIRKTGSYSRIQTTTQDQLFRFLESTSHIKDPGAQRVLTDIFADTIKARQVPPVVASITTTVRPTPMDSAIKAISVRQLIDDYLIPAGIVTIPHSDGSVSKLYPKPVCQYLVKYHRDALPAQRNPSASYKDRLVNTEKVDDIIKSLQQQQLRHERSFVS